MDEYDIYQNIIITIRINGGDSEVDFYKNQIVNYENVLKEYSLNNDTRLFILYNNLINNGWYFEEFEFDNLTLLYQSKTRQLKLTKNCYNEYLEISNNLRKLAELYYGNYWN